MDNIGINISDKEYPFTQWIISGAKTIETRNKPTLRPYIGKRVGIIRTGKGKSACVGFATIAEEITYTDYGLFNCDRYLHMIDPYMESYSFHDVKYGYRLTDVVPCEPFYPCGNGIVSRKLFSA